MPWFCLTTPMETRCHSKQPNNRYAGRLPESKIPTGTVRLFALSGGATMDMVWCPPETFWMGSPESEEGRRGNELRYRVTLPTRRDLRRGRSGYCAAGAGPSTPVPAGPPGASVSSRHTGPPASPSVPVASRGRCDVPIPPADPGAAGVTEFSLCPRTALGESGRSRTAPPQSPPGTNTARTGQPVSRIRGLMKKMLASFT